MPAKTIDIAGELAEFEIDLTETQVQQIASYVDLLERWSKVINLTAIRDTKEVVRRQFAESIYIERFAHLKGPLLDVGSGAGFPGLALKIAAPELQVVLLEPVNKKRAFLKEVIRQCGLVNVEVNGARVEDYSAGARGRFESVTVRAVGSFPVLLPAVADCLAASGSVYLWLTREEAVKLSRGVSGFSTLFEWEDPVPVPFSREREIWRGKPCCIRF